MLIRVRSDIGLWRVPDLDDETATVFDILVVIEESVRPGTAYDRPLSFDPQCRRAIDRTKTLKEQGLEHGSMIYCRVATEGSYESYDNDVDVDAVVNDHDRDGDGDANDGGNVEAAGPRPRIPRLPDSGRRRQHLGANAAELRARALQRQQQQQQQQQQEEREAGRESDGVDNGDAGGSEGANADRDGNEPAHGDHDDDCDGPPICRICLGEGTTASSSRASPSPSPSAEERLISPCLCRGTVRYVHVSCLQTWRASAHGRSDSALRCGQCRYAYGVRRSGWALFLMSDHGAMALAAAAMFVVVHLLGIAAYAATPAEGRDALYRWLRLGDHRGGGNAFLRETTYGEVLTLGGTVLGCVTFANYAVTQTTRHYALYREGIIDASRLYYVGFLLYWIYSEVAHRRSGRGLAVAGLFMACYHSYEGAMAKAKVAAQWLGETILEPTAADRRRHEREERERRRTGQAVGE